MHEIQRTVYINQYAAAQVIQIDIGSRLGQFLYESKISRDLYMQAAFNFRGWSPNAIVIMEGVINV